MEEEGIIGLRISDQPLHCLQLTNMSMTSVDLLKDIANTYDVLFSWHLSRVT